LESEERKRLQSELEAGLSEFSTSIDQAAKDFKESSTGQRIKEEATDLHERLRAVKQPMP